MRTRGYRAWAQLLVVAGAAALLMGCPSYSSMTTAKPVTPGRVEFAISPGAIGLNAAALGSSTGSETYILPTVDFGVRYGFHERFDAGFQLSGWGNFGLDGKINFVDSEVFALAFDPSINGTFFSAGDVDAGFIQFQTPVLIDLAPDDWVRFTLGPRYVGLSAFASSGDSSESDFASFVGSSLGVEFVINDTVRLQPHGGVVTWVNNPADTSVFLFTAGLAIKLRAGKADKPEPAPAGGRPE